MSKVGLFLQRWSRLKSQPAAEPVPAQSAPPDAPDADNRLELPAVDDLTLESDFSAFMQPEVDADTRRAAMKKLFMNDHYRTMDMLDVYVDDYSKPEVLPAAMLHKLEHAVGLLAKPNQAEQSVAAAGERVDDAGAAKGEVELGGGDHAGAHAGSINEAGESSAAGAEPEPPVAG